MYDFPLFHILYGAHLPEQTFVHVEDMIWENWEQDHIYLISWYGSEIPAQVQDQYQMKFVECGTMNFERGYFGIKLYRIDMVR